MNWEEYKIVKNSIQLIHVELDSLECKKLTGKNRSLQLSLSRSIGKCELNKAEIFLKTIIDFQDDGPFYLNASFKGICENTEKIDEDKFRDYVYTQIIPLLLPYARECVTNILSRMNIPIFYLPTIDVLNTISANKE